MIRFLQFKLDLVAAGEMAWVGDDARTVAESRQAMEVDDAPDLAVPGQPDYTDFWGKRLNAQFNFSVFADGDAPYQAYVYIPRLSGPEGDNVTYADLTLITLEETYQKAVGALVDQRPFAV